MTETKTLYPAIDVFPACSKCGVAYVLRRSEIVNLATGDIRTDWAWQKDCQPKKPCQNAPAELVNADGTAYDRGRTDAE